VEGHGDEDGVDDVGDAQPVRPQPGDARHDRALGAVARVDLDQRDHGERGQHQQFDAQQRVLQARGDLASPSTVRTCGRPR